MAASNPGTASRRRAKAQRAERAGRQAFHEALVLFRKYQLPVFQDHITKTLLIHWSRQIGKSFTLAAWAVDRCLRIPGRLVTVLSNSKDNGAEFALKAAEIALKLGQAVEFLDLAEDVSYNAMRFEVRIKIGNVESRIKVLAANPRTARGFSGDLILDEFAFHENSRAIWEAAEPIISSNPDFLCRIASTGNGRGNMFYQLIHDGKLPYYKMSRSAAHAMGELKIYSMITGKEITPDQARAEAHDKAAYDQNYECLFTDENMALLRHDWINAAETLEIFPDIGEWGTESLDRLAACETALDVGIDIGSTENLTVVWVNTQPKKGFHQTVAILELHEMTLRAQYRRIRPLLVMAQLRKVCFDMTGLGLGLFQEAQEKHGPRMLGIHFASTVPVNPYLKNSGYKEEKALVGAVMATDMAAAYEDCQVAIPTEACYPELRADLRKPSKVVSPSGKVSIAATNNEEGHADRFWAQALAIRAGTLDEALVGDVSAIRTQAGEAELNGSSRRHFIARHFNRQPRTP